MANCTLCRKWIPDDQEICSLCHGNPNHGHDSYLMQYYEEYERNRKDKKVVVK